LTHETALVIPFSLRAARYLTGPYSCCCLRDDCSCRIVAEVRAHRCAQRRGPHPHGGGLAGDRARHPAPQHRRHALPRAAAAAGRHAAQRPRAAGGAGGAGGGQLRAPRPEAAALEALTERLTRQNTLLSSQVTRLTSALARSEEEAAATRDQAVQAEAQARSLQRQLDASRREAAALKAALAAADAAAAVAVASAGVRRNLPSPAALLARHAGAADPRSPSSAFPPLPPVGRSNLLCPWCTASRDIRNVGVSSCMYAAQLPETLG